MIVKYYKGVGVYSGIYVPEEDAFPYAMHLVVRSHVEYIDFLKRFKEWEGTFEQFQEDFAKYFFEEWDVFVTEDDSFIFHDCIEMLDSWKDVVWT